MSIQSKGAPFGQSVWGLVLAMVVAVVLVGAYFDGSDSVTRGAFAVAALVVLGRQIRAFRRRTQFGRGTAA